MNDDQVERFQCGRKSGRDGIDDDDNIFDSTDQDNNHVGIVTGIVPHMLMKMVLVTIMKVVKMLLMTTIMMTTVILTMRIILTMKMTSKTMMTNERFPGWQ